MSGPTDRITGGSGASGIWGGQEGVSNTTEHVYIPCTTRLRATLLCALREGTAMGVIDRVLRSPAPEPSRDPPSFSRY